MRCSLSWFRTILPKSKAMSLNGSAKRIFTRWLIMVLFPFHLSSNLLCQEDLYKCGVSNMVIVFADTVERFHIMAHLVFVLAQNIQNTEEFWLWSFVSVRVFCPLWKTHCSLAWNMALTSIKNLKVRTCLFSNVLSSSNGVAIETCTECRDGALMWSSCWCNQAFFLGEIQWDKTWCILGIPPSSL